MDHSEQGPDLPMALRTHWRTVGACTVACLALGSGAGLALEGPAVHAQATVALTAPSSVNVVAPGVQGDAALARYTSQRALFMRSDDVVDVAAATARTTPGRLRRALTVTPSSTTTSVVVRAGAGTASEAVAEVEAVVSAYRAQTSAQVLSRTTSAQRSIDSELDRLQQTPSGGPGTSAAQATATALSELTQKASTLQTDGALFGDGVDFVQAATLANAERTGPPLRDAALGLLLGLGVGATAAWRRADRAARRPSPADRPGRDPEGTQNAVTPLSAPVR